jgi:type IV pilus assembly protein PilW
MSARRTAVLTTRPTPGLTLVELLVAMAIGLGVLLAAGRLLVLAGAAHAVQGELGAVDDGGRFALELLGRALRQAGAPAQPGTPPATGLVTGLDARSLTRTGAAFDEALLDAVNGSDVLAVRFPGAGPGPGGDGSVLDCAGFPVAQGEEGWSIFYVARNARGEAELRCKYRGAAHWTSDAVVSGVDGFQVLYGIDTDTPRDSTPNRYLNADAISALETAGTGAGVPGGWARVVSVRVGLLLHGERPTRRGGHATYHLLGPAYAGAGGGDDGAVLREDALGPALRDRERRLFAATVALRGQPP